LIIVFAGVSAAFVVENYLDSKNQEAEFRQALSINFAKAACYRAKGIENLWPEFNQLILNQLRDFSVTRSSGLKIRRISL